MSDLEPRIDLKKTEHGWSVGSQYWSVTIKDEDTAKAVFSMVKRAYQSGFTLGQSSVRDPFIKALNILTREG